MFSERGPQPTFELGKRGRELGLAGLAIAKLLEAGDAHAGTGKELSPEQRVEWQERFTDVKEKGGTRVAADFSFGVDGKTMDWSVTGYELEGRRSADKSELVLVFEHDGKRGDPSDDVRILTYYRHGGPDFPAVGSPNYSRTAREAKYEQAIEYGSPKAFRTFMDVMTDVGQDMGAKDDRYNNGRVGVQMLLMEGVHAVGIEDENFDRFFHGSEIAEHLQPTHEEKVAERESNRRWELSGPSITVSFANTGHDGGDRDEQHFRYAKYGKSYATRHPSEPTKKDVIWSSDPETTEKK